MDANEIAVSAVAFVAATWLAGFIMKELKLPRVAAPVVGLVATAVVNNAMRKLA